MLDIRVIGKDTLDISLDTTPGRYFSFTQYNNGVSDIVINKPTLDELTQLQKAITILKANLKHEKAQK